MRAVRAIAGAVVGLVLVGLMPTAAHADVPPPTYCSAWGAANGFLQRACVVMESSTRIGHQIQITNLAGAARTAAGVIAVRYINGVKSSCYSGSPAFSAGQTRYFDCWSVRISGYTYQTEVANWPYNDVSPTITG